MQGVNEVLTKTECCFNWDLSGLYEPKDRFPSATDYFRNKLELNDTIESGPSWMLRYVFEFERFQSDPDGDETSLDEIIDGVLESADDFTRKWQVPALHILYSTKAFMLLKKKQDSSEVIEGTVDLIKTKENMSNEEMSGLLAMKAHVLRLYGVVGTQRSVDLLRDAIRFNPHEPEWSLSLAASMVRNKKFIRGTNIEWSEIEEPVDILKNLLHHPGLTQQQRVTCKYYLAKAYYAYTFGKKKWTKEVKEVTKQRVQLCKEIYPETNHPHILVFCALTSDNKYGGKQKSMEVLTEALKRFPNDIEVNTTACTMYQRRGNHALAAKYGQTALDNGGYGVAWQLLDSKVNLQEEFDEEEYFQRLLTSFPTLYKKRTLVQASMYYFFSRTDSIKGAHYMEQAILEEQNSPADFKGGRRSKEIHALNWIQWKMQKMVPIEAAYKQIVKSLSEQKNNPTLLRVKSKIEEVADVSKFI